MVIDSAAGSVAPGDSGGGLRWHQALAWAVTGQAHPELGEQRGPDLPALAERLLAEPGARQQIQQLTEAERARGATWPTAVPPQLMGGLGAAQFTAALADLCRLLSDVTSPGAPLRPVLSSRAPDAAERRLLEDVPPHHGV